MHIRVDDVSAFVCETWLFSDGGDFNISDKNPDLSNNNLEWRETSQGHFGKQISSA